jgi:hypothetical protein
MLVNNLNESPMKGDKKVKMKLEMIKEEFSRSREEDLNVRCKLAAVGCPTITMELASPRGGKAPVLLSNIASNYQKDGG